MIDNNRDRDGLEASLASLLRCRHGRTANRLSPQGNKVHGQQLGSNRSSFRGSGMEFDEVRVYQAGDDERAIDWRVTARTGTMHTKLFHEERERPVLLLVDLRSNMQFGTRVQFKSTLAAHIGAKLAWTAIDSGDRVGGFLLTPSGTRTFPIRRGTAATMTFLKGMAEATNLYAEAGDEAPLHVTIDRLRQVSRPGTLVYIISDFVDCNEQTERAIRRLALHAHITNIMLFDPLETSLPSNGDYRVSDGSGVISLGAVGKAALLNHIHAFEARRQRIETLSRQRGMAFLAIATHDDANAVLRPQRPVGANEIAGRRLSA